MIFSSVNKAIWMSVMIFPQLGFSAESGEGPTPTEWLKENPCHYIQMASLYRLSSNDVKQEIEVERIDNLFRFLFSKPSAEVVPGDLVELKVRPIEKQDKDSTICKMKSNATVESLLTDTLDVSIPHETCKDLNLAYLRHFDLEKDIEIVEVEKSSGPQFVFQKVEVEKSDDKIVVKIPSLKTKVGNGLFDGMHYCKVVSVDTLM